MPAEKIYEFEENPIASVIIPSLDGVRNGNVNNLVETIKQQSFKSIEIIISKNESPNGHARNVGFKKVNHMSKYLIFFDDDVTLGNNSIISNFIEVLNDPVIGLVGASQIPPKESTIKQLWLGYDLNRAKFDIVNQLTVSDMVTHAGMACRKEVWIELGGESSKLVTGTDTDLRERLNKNGYKNVIAPNTYVYHPLPSSFINLFRNAIFHGKNQYQYRKKNGFQKSLIKPFKRIYNRKTFLYSLIFELFIFIPHIFIANRKFPFGFRPINAIFRFLMVVSYIKETYKNESSKI